MRKLFLLSIICLLFSTSAAYAQDMAIGVFDVQKVASDSDAIKAAKEEIDKKFGKQKSDLEKERANIEKKAQDYRKKRPTEKQQQALMKQNNEFTEKMQAFVKLLQAEETRFRTELEGAIAKAAKEVAVKKNLTLILDRAAVPYFDPKHDVTADMLNEVNALTKKAPAGN